MHRTWGGIAAGVPLVLPSLFMLVGLAWIYMAYGLIPAVAGVLCGIKPAVTAVVASAEYRIGSRVLTFWMCPSSDRCVQSRSTAALIGTLATTRHLVLSMALLSVIIGSGRLGFLWRMIH